MSKKYKLKQLRITGAFILLLLMGSITIKAQNVGISDAAFTPQNLLHVHNTTGTSIFQITNSTTGAGIGAGSLIREIADDFEFLSQEAAGNMLFNVAASTKFIFNDNGLSVDLQVKGDNNDNLLFIDGSADKIGIGTNTPSYELSINGDLEVLGNEIYGGASGTLYMYSNGSIRMDLDNDGGGSEKFSIANGSNTLVLEVFESGDIVGDGNADFDGNVTLTGSSARTFRGPVGGASDYPLDIKSASGLDIYIDDDNDGTASEFYVKTDNAGDVNLFRVDEDGDATVYRVLKISPQSSTPAGTEGDFYSDATDNIPYYHDGTAWRAFLLGNTGWALAGNANTSAGTDFLGTTDQEDIVVKTNNTERMRVNGENDAQIGFVGIGTSDPLQPLHVEGDVIIGSTTIYDGPSEFIRIFGQSHYWSLGTVNDATEAGTDFFIGHDDDIPDGIFHIENTGDIGIGLTDPTEKLHVYDNSNTTKNTIYAYADQTSTTVDYHNSAITGFASGGNASYGNVAGVMGIADQAGSWKAIGIYAALAASVPDLTTKDYDVALYADGNSLGLSGIFVGGSVGIGTTAPETWALLQVEVADADDAVYIKNTDATSATDAIFRIDARSGVTNSLRVQRDGKVGIGESTPAMELDVNGYIGATNQITIIPLWQAGSEYNMTNTTGADLSNCESGLEPALFQISGNVQVKLVIRVTDKSVGSTNYFQLRAHDGTTQTWPITSADSWTWASTQTGQVVTSEWKNWNAGTNAQEIHLFGWTVTGGDYCKFNSAYLMVRPQQ